jgi:hypothetical protein
VPLHNDAHLVDPPVAGVMVVVDLMEVLETVLAAAVAVEE